MDRDDGADDVDELFNSLHRSVFEMFLFSPSPSFSSSPSSSSVMAWSNESQLDSIHFPIELHWLLSLLRFIGILFWVEEEEEKEEEEEWGFLLAMFVSFLGHSFPQIQIRAADVIFVAETETFWVILGIFKRFSIDSGCPKRLPHTKNKDSWNAVTIFRRSSQAGSNHPISFMELMINGTIKCHACPCKVNKSLQFLSESVIGLWKFQRDSCRDSHHLQCKWTSPVGFNELPWFERHQLIWIELQCRGGDGLLVFWHEQNRLETAGEDQDLEEEEEVEEGEGEGKV